MVVKCETCGDEFGGEILDRPLEARDELPYFVLHRDPDDEDLVALDAVEHVYLCSYECVREFVEEEDDDHRLANAEPTQQPDEDGDTDG
jgi:hypothetical protein